MSGSTVGPVIGHYTAKGRSIRAISHGIEFTIARVETRGRMKHIRECEEATARLLAMSDEMADFIRLYVIDDVRDVTWGVLRKTEASNAAFGGDTLEIKY